MQQNAPFYVLLKKIKNWGGGGGGGLANPPRPSPLPLLVSRGLACMPFITNIKSKYSININFLFSYIYAVKKISV